MDASIPAVAVQAAPWLHLPGRPRPVPCKTPQLKLPGIQNPALERVPRQVPAYLTRARIPFYRPRRFVCLIRVQGERAVLPGWAVLQVWSVRWAGQYSRRFQKTTIAGFVRGLLPPGPQIALRRPSQTR